MKRDNLTCEICQKVRVTCSQSSRGFWIFSNDILNISLDGKFVGCAPWSIADCPVVRNEMSLKQMLEDIKRGIWASNSGPMGSQ